MSAKNDIRAGIRFNDKHSYFDYGLYLNKPPDYGNPTARTITVEIPGMNGVLDYTEAITGDVNYTNRMQTYTFAKEIDRWDREALKAEITNDIHGKIVKVFPDEDSGWYFEGRASVKFTDVNYWKMKVVITVDASPFRLATEETEVVVDPSQLGQNDSISFGQGLAYSGSNSAWIFGSETQTDYDFSGFLRFNFAWIDSPYRAGAFIQLNDTEGHVYNQPISIIGPVGNEVVDLTDVSPVDTSKIWRVLVSGVGRVEMWGVLSGVACTQKIYNSRMPVVPDIESTFENDVQVTINGVMATVSPGGNYIPELKLKEGENEFSVLAPEPTGELTMKYREGRL